ncbi:MAG: phosphoribosyltransferase family protein [Bacteroidia bacterium]
MRHKEHPQRNINGQWPVALRIVLHGMRRLDDLSDAARKSFSEMKYGSPEAIEAWGTALSDAILQNPEVKALVASHGGLAIASSAYGSVPTAAKALKNVAAQHLKDAGWQVDIFHIQRSGGFERTNYGALQERTRERVMRHRKVALSAETAASLKDKVILIVDDLRCTGAHERAIEAMIHSQVEGARLIFAYCVEFEGEMPAGTEETLNHSAIQSFDDLLLMVKGREGALTLNARLLKYVLLQPNAEVDAYIDAAGRSASLELYRAAMSSDGYFDKSRFQKGFKALEEGLLRRGWTDRRESLDAQNALQGKLVRWNVSESQPGVFLDAGNGGSLDVEIARYSRFKFGDVEAIQQLGRELAGVVIAALERGGSLRTVFEQAGERDEFVSITAPGVRNVVSASNFLMREVAQRVNLWLSHYRLPTMAIRTLGRLRSGRDNYAQLSSKGRAERDLRTQTLVPRSEYQAYPSHVIFLDDVEVTGQTVNRAREESLSAGALSFHAIYVFRVEARQAAQDPGIEHRMNQAVVTGGLDEVVAEILGHPDYQPVQRMLRLLLHPRNREELGGFLADAVGDVVLTRLYVGAVGNDYLWINGEAAGELGLYGASVEILRGEMLRRGLVDVEGLLV